jgi:hypothetical protein
MRPPRLSPPLGAFHTKKFVGPVGGGPRRPSLGQERLLRAAGFSIMVECGAQVEIDRLWDALLEAAARG